jgi:hypothetical protein
MLRDIDSDAAAWVLGRGVKELRDLRAARLTNHLGERIGKSWHLSFPELVELGVAETLRGFGMRVGAAYEIARRHSQQIRAALPPNGGDDVIMIAFSGRPDEPCDGSAIARAGDTAPTARAILAVNIGIIAADIDARLRDCATQRAA